MKLSQIPNSHTLSLHYYTINNIMHAAKKFLYIDNR